MASAHLYQPSFERTIQGFLVDVGYSIANPMPNEQVRFDFDLYSGTGDTIAYAPFQSVTFTTAQSGKIVFTKTIANTSANVPALIYAFPAIGNYDLTISYDRGTQGKIATTFQLPVGNDSVASTQNLSPYILGIILLLVAVYVFYIIRQQRG